MVTLSLCNSNSIIHGSKIHEIQWNPFPISPSGYSLTLKNHQEIARRCRRRLTVVAVTEGSAKKSNKSRQEEVKEEEVVPAWARLDSNEPPPWARNEAQKGGSESVVVPFYVYLLASAVTAIAAVGSVFEYINQKPVFGLVESDSIFYAPLLGFFAITGIPTSGFLWYKSVQAANKEAEEQDKRDGYL